ncbi:MAG: hypothetical protein IPO62_16995 [Saprospiraceae bacterium]|nr:hypothetical protein [Saprospiraceae bacterium]
MKNLFFVLCVFFVGGMVQLSAQACSKSKASGCCSSKSASAAIKAAELDPSIEKKVCENSGKLSFYRNTTDEKGVTVSTQVMYDEGKAMFVNYSPEAAAASETKSTKACCSKSGAKSCSKSKAENTSPVN